MNRAYLNQLLLNPKQISNTDVYELEQLCKEFPFFSVPHLLLAQTHKQHSDYRASDALHAAALRLSSRPWLRQFVEQSWEDSSAVAAPQVPETANTVIPEAAPVTNSLPEQPESPELSSSISPVPPDTEEPQPNEQAPDSVHSALLDEPPAYSIELFFPETIQPQTPNTPKDFYTWLKDPKNKEAPAPPRQKEHKQTDDLIQRFLKTNPSISRPKKEFFNPLNVAKKSEQMDETLITETLAQIYWKQGNLKAALQAFERLMLKFPEKRPYFAGLIQKIRNELNQN
ncbi:MAG: hypothetical protein RL160_1557 [Bacteroidota bacterium]|jgi:hypothetical protein